MVVNIQEKEIELKYSLRALMIYENIVGSSFEPKGITEIITYFYSIIMASDKESTLDYNDFIDWLDENPNAIEEFSQWLVAVTAKNTKMSKKEQNTTVSTVSKKKQK